MAKRGWKWVAELGDQMLFGIKIARNVVQPFFEILPWKK
jgi:hypothetical protein